MRLVHRTHRQEVGKVDERLPNDETPNDETPKDETPSTQGRTEVSSGSVQRPSNGNPHALKE
jgi:hypothetical protein